MSRLSTPVVFMRGGTSKGLFFHERNLPPPGETRDRLLLTAMGSPDPYGRQLDGMGGGLSSLSKVIVVRPSQRADADIEYLHGQVAIDQPLIDWSANCGNLSVAVGPFAIDEGLFTPGGDREALVRLHNLNSGARIEARVPLDGGRFEPGGSFAMPGVSGTGARVALEYLADEGVTLFPTGQPFDTLVIGGTAVAITAAFASLPCVFVRAEDVGLSATMTPAAIDANGAAKSLLEDIRRAAAVRMGLASSINAVPLATPKIGIVAQPQDYLALDGTSVHAGDCDILVRMISAGQAHKAVPLAAAMCLAASCLPSGTIPRACAGGVCGPAVRIGNPSGVLPVGAVLRDGPVPQVERTVVYATARRLMEGRV